jgi:hypothetical protein
MIEEGVRLPSRVWKKIGLRDISSASNFTQLLAIYDKWNAAFIYFYFYNFCSQFFI